MIISEALRLSEKLVNSDSARLDVELLLAFVMGATRTYLYTWPERALTDAQVTRFQQLLARRAEGEPIAYIIQVREFWSLPIGVEPSTLIPRPDTEVLVEAVLECNVQHPPRSILDLGTGTGAIAFALSMEYPKAKIVGVDSSSEAVKLAERNRVRLAIYNVAFLISDWFSSVQGKFDVIVSNPPYIDINDPHLAQGDVRFEPASALVAANNGFADLQSIIQRAPEYLNKGAWLFLEHGYRQADRVKDMLKLQGFVSIVTRKDYGDNERVTGGCWHG
jgi:release factor glutamine methyltransferase